MAQGQGTKGTRAAKIRHKRHKGSEEKAQGQARKETRVGKKRHKGRQEKSKKQARKMS
jgi:hypothetical protein